MWLSMKYLANSSLFEFNYVMRNNKQSRKALLSRYQPRTINRINSKDTKSISDKLIFYQLTIIIIGAKMILFSVLLPQLHIHNLYRYKYMQEIGCYNFLHKFESIHAKSDSWRRR